MSSFLRSLFGKRPDPGVAAVELAQASARDARAAADEMRALVETVRAEHHGTIAKVEGELARLSARLEAMPEMRSQLEAFVQSLGRTMAVAAERLETVDDRIHHVEQHARTQTELLALSRTELDRQGRVVSSVDTQMKSLEASIDRLATASARAEALMRDLESRRVRVGIALSLAIGAIGVAILALVLTQFR